MIQFYASLQFNSLIANTSVANTSKYKLSSEDTCKIQGVGVLGGIKVG